MTFPVNYEDAGSAANFPTDAPQVEFNRDGAEEVKTTRKDIDYSNYDEDIYVGYRYFDSFNKTVSYPFGYGLSYTQFAYSNFKTELQDDMITISIDVKNIGKTAGKEIVEVYAAAPDSKNLNKPEKELKAFAKTRTLQTGETCRMTLQFAVSELASYDEIAQGWRIDAGNYQILIGSSSRDIKTKGNVKVSSSFVKCHNILALKKALKLSKRSS